MALKTKYEDRIFNSGEQQMRRSSYNVIQKITALRGFDVSYDKVLNHCANVSEAVNDYMDQLNDSIKDEKLITLGTFEFIDAHAEDSNLPDYLSTVAGLMESLVPMKALGLTPATAPTYADAIGYKITNELSEYVVRKIDSDLKTDNLDAFDALEYTVKNMLLARFFTFNRYCATRQMSVQTDEDKELAKENYDDALESMTNTVMADLLTQGQSIVDAIGIPEFKKQLTDIDPGLESYASDDIAYSAEYILSPEYYNLIMGMYKSNYDKASAQGATEAELMEYRKKATEVHNAWTSLRTANQSPSFDPNNKTKLPGQQNESSLNSIQYPVALYQMLLYASKELYNKEFDEETANPAVLYVLDVIKEASSQVLPDDLVSYTETFPYKWLSTFHMAHNADLSIWFSLADTGIIQAVSTLDQILKGLTPEEARAEARQRLEEMRSQGEE